MTLRKITANYIFTLTGKPVKDGILICDEQGTIIEIIESQKPLHEIAGLEQYTGIICPGFVNAHCHLELSHLKNKIERGIGLTGFLNQLFILRNASEEAISLSIRQADLFIQKSGTVAVGDISNTTSTILTKKKSPVYYHTFIEAFGFAPERAQDAMKMAQINAKSFTSNKLHNSTTPHSPYSVSHELFHLLIQESIQKKYLLSLHHQESAEEDKLFRTKSGALLQRYKQKFHLNTDFWKASGKSSTQTILTMIPRSTPLLLTHNTYLQSEDSLWLAKNRQSNNTFLVTCPNANLYIENRLPDYNLFKQSSFPICIGTDSLASNSSLSMINEMLIIQENHPINLNELLLWGCRNGAMALQIEDWAGSLSPGKQPGINLLSGIDLKKLRLTKNTKVQKLA